ncbi:thioredoxin family protein [Streptomyces albidoflavus]|uniref:thioredoxin family protein n=1 Tax=Streptomyces albidoflavus TaxID=1886 RepID=UPI0033EDC4CB
MADGRETVTGGTAGDGAEVPIEVLDAGLLGAELGERATLVQFSTAFCQPCRATRRVLDDVAALVPGVRHVEIDAEAHLGLVRAVGVERTPTVLILDDRGRVALRATGAPRKAEVLAGLAHTL